MKQTDGILESGRGGPGSGAPLKQPHHQHTGGKCWDRTDGATHGWVVLHMKLCFKMRERRGGSDFFPFRVFTPLHMQAAQLSATEWNVYFSHRSESVPIGLSRGMRPNRFLMLLSLVMSSYTCWKWSNLPVPAPPLTLPATNTKQTGAEVLWISLALFSRSQPGWDWPVPQLPGY